MENNERQEYFSVSTDPLYNVSPGQITRLKRNQNVNIHTIDMLCRILDCKIEDIMEYVDEE